MCRIAFLEIFLEEIYLNKIPVLVTGIGGGGVGEQILKCLRMSKMPYYIVGGDMNRNSKGFKLVDQAYILPPASDTWKGTLRP